MFIGKPLVLGSILQNDYFLEYLLWGTIFWPNQHDRMNVTEKFVHDRKDHTDKHERWKLTKKVRQRRT